MQEVKQSGTSRKGCFNEVSRVYYITLENGGDTVELPFTYS
jgi:hypothetical protein